MELYATSAEMEKYGYGGEKDKHGNVINGPIFGENFVKAPWNRKQDGWRVKDPSNNVFNDKWCYLNRFKGCTGFDRRNNDKLAKYLEAKSDYEIAINNPKNRQGFFGSGTRRVGKKTRRLRRKGTRRR